MAEAESEEAVRLRNKASEMLKGPSFIAHPTSKEHKSSYFFTQSSAEMVDNRLQNQSCVIRKEIGKTPYGERPVYSSLARLPTFSIGLSSTQDEAPPRAPPHESRVDPEDKSPHRYFQMPELGARVFVGDVDGFDTIACHLFAGPYSASEFHLDSEYAAVTSLYKNDRPGGLSGWLRARPEEFFGSENYSDMILHGTELFVPAVNWHVETMVGSLGGKSSSASGSSSDYKDGVGNETIRQPSDIVEQPRDPVPGVYYYRADPWTCCWRRFELPDLPRSYLKMRIFMEKYRHIKYQRSRSEPSLGGVPLGDGLQLTRFDDFVILGNGDLFSLTHYKIMDIVRENASETADVIAAQLVKQAAMGKIASFMHPTTAIVIFLDHQEILLRDHENKKQGNIATENKAILLGLKGISQSTVLKDDKKIAELTKEEKITTLKNEEEIFASKREHKKGIMMEVDQKVKILGGEPLPNDPQISTISSQFQENEVSEN